MQNQKILFVRETHPEIIYPLLSEYAGSFFASGNLCIKVHSGEEGNVNYLTPQYLGNLLSNLHGTICETNTAYEGERNTTEKHLELLRRHGWTKYPCDILDSEGDTAVDIKNGLILKRTFLGSHVFNYNKCLVISHVKAHPMGGFGGAIKQLSIGFASPRGKQNIHGGGSIEIGDRSIKNTKSANQDSFLMAMADSAKVICDHFRDNIIFVNILKNIATSCDCDANAPEAEAKDIGILIGDDPVAIDAASLSMLKSESEKDEALYDVLDVIDRMQGQKIIEYGRRNGLGKSTYLRVEADPKYFLGR